jgi:hypothetical protein
VKPELINFTAHSESDCRRCRPYGHSSTDDVAVAGCDGTCSYYVHKKFSPPNTAKAMTGMRHHIPSADDIADIDDKETAWFVSKRFRQDTHSMGVEPGSLVQQANDSAAMHDNSASHQKSSRVSTEVAEQERREHAANIEYFFNDPVLSDSTTMIIVFQLEEPMKRDCSLTLPPPSKYQRPTRN